MLTKNQIGWGYARRSVIVPVGKAAPRVASRRTYNSYSSYFCSKDT